jgi:two-component system cell cycle sensor histidine kinase/response regulator CckA
MAEGAGKCILNVDDDEAGRYALSRILTAAGYRVVEASSGEEALRLAGELPDLILLDVNLPDMSGFEVCRRLRADTRTASIPIIHVSATYVRSEYRTAGLDGGADGYIVQPVDARELVATVAALLRLKETEKALRASEQWFRTLADATATAIFIYQGECFVYVNRASEILSGYAKDELVGMRFYDLVHPRFRDMVRQRGLDRQRGIEVPNRYEFTIVRKDGSERWVDYSAGKIEWQGRPAVLGTAVDITERKQAEEALRQAQRLEAIGRLAGGVAHDFNNLLSVINGYCNLMLTQLDETHPLRADLEAIERAGRQAASLTQQLLAFSRRQILKPEVLNLNTVVAETHRMLKRVIGEDIDLVFVPAEDLGNVKVDPGQAEQVLMNLAVNARDAMPLGGTLTIETMNVELDEDYARQHPGVQPGRYVMLAVSDTGTGMDEAVRERIFEPFFTTKELGKGTGLGLAMVYGIVKQSGGNIWAYSEVGKGSTFKVYLPRVDEEVRERRPEPAEPRALGSETVLLVEDDEAVRKLAGRMLEGAGYKVLTADGGPEALRLVESAEKAPDILVTDVVMPAMSGRELWERLRARHPGMRVLYISGYTDNAIAHYGLLDPGTHLVSKPFTAGELAGMVRRVLDE